jgi:hypothetical protein
VRLPVPVTSPSAAEPGPYWKRPRRVQRAQGRRDERLSKRNGENAPVYLVGEPGQTLSLIQHARAAVMTDERQMVHLYDDRNGRQGTDTELETDPTIGPDLAVSALCRDQDAGVIHNGHAGRRVSLRTPQLCPSAAPPTRSRSEPSRYARFDPDLR